MRVVRVLALALVLTLALATVASARVRHDVRDAAADAAGLLSLDDPAPSVDQTAAPAPEPSHQPQADGSVAGLPGDDHGAAVSAVAKSGETATWVNPAGKEITNHGKAVSTTAKSAVGKPAKVNGKDKGAE